MFALVKPPSPSFSQGLTSQSLGQPDYRKAVEQHKAYCKALEGMGFKLHKLEPDGLPDSCFVEDMAIMLGSGQVLLTRSEVRKAEQQAVIEALPTALVKCRIQAPGSLEGGDVLRLGKRWFVGVGARTNEDGFQQFREIVQGQATALPLKDLLHLKTGVTPLNPQTVLALPPLAATFRQLGYQVAEVHPHDWHAANVVSWRRQVLLPAHHPRVRDRLQDLGFETLEVDLSEFKKQDGGATCLSLLWAVDEAL